MSTPKPVKKTDKKPTKPSKSEPKERAAKEPKEPKEKKTRQSKNWEEVVQKRLEKSTRLNPDDGKLPKSASPDVFKIEEQTPQEKTSSAHDLDFTKPWTELIPREVQELCTQAGFTTDFCQQNVKVIYSVGIFLQPDQFEKRFPPGTESYCDPKRVEAAQALVQVPAKPIKKLFKSFKPVGEGTIFLFLFSFLLFFLLFFPFFV